MTGKMLAVCGGGRVENGVGVEGTVDRKVVGGGANCRFASTEISASVSVLTVNVSARSQSQNSGLDFDLKKKKKKNLFVT